MHQDAQVCHSDLLRCHISNDYASYREILFTRDGQPFLIAGSGTLGWDQVGANLVEPGEDVGPFPSQVDCPLRDRDGVAGSCTQFGIFWRLLCRMVRTHTAILRLAFPKQLNVASPHSLETYGANVTQVKAPLGAAVTELELEKYYPLIYESRL